MTQNEVDIIKNSTIDATEAYVEARLAVADFVKTQIGVVESASKNSAGKWVHTVRCNATSSTSGIVYNNVLSVNNIHFQTTSVVFMLVPNAQFSNQFILGKLDNVPYDIVGGSIRIGGTENDPNFYVDSSGNCTCKSLTANVGGSIGGFTITSNSLGDELGDSEAVGMVAHSHLFAYSSSGGTEYKTRIYPHEIEMFGGTISVNYGSSWIHISASNIENNSLGYVRWHGESSDKRYKKNIKEISANKVRNFFKEIKPSTFIFDTAKLDDKNDLSHYGVIAQNLQSSLEKADLKTDNIIMKSKTKDMLLVDYQELHGLELAGIKDLYKQIDALKAQIEAK